MACTCPNHGQAITHDSLTPVFPLLRETTSPIQSQGLLILGSHWLTQNLVRFLGSHESAGLGKGLKLP